MSYVSNLHYSHGRIRTWRAYDIGPGKSVPWTKFSIPEECELPTIEAIRPRRTGGHSLVTEKEDSSESEDESSDTLSSATNSRLFTCPEEGCIKSFMRHPSLVKHLDCEKHKRKL
ncbi:unnamed protein product [Porites evermanni]|uniref:C2H2-type domain-containing protein n=1 Tax=Porites evermanni TaxID=104178 RepID=A0ABN8RKV7_9CNID|nr:unnamed protein product [Porites evermanni]